MEDVHEEPLFVQRVAGLDIAKAEVEVTIRVPSDTSPGRRQQETRTFGTTRRELESLADWLRSWGVTKVGMEATSDYWKPVFFLLESRGFDCDLYNAAQVRALPGRCSSCSNPAGSTATCITPRRSGPCPAGLSGLARKFVGGP